jgi:DNA processing protein
MIHIHSPNTQAILLLTAPLIVGRGTSSTDLLTASEYKRLARLLFEKKRQPADLLSAEVETLLRECQPIVDCNRLKRLLERGFLLSQAMERWQTRSIWVVSRADNFYPKGLRSHMKEDSPAILYGCGEINFIDSGGLAVVGSRNVDDELIAYTENIGRLAAKADRTLVSGGARGIDQAAMRGALEAGGKVIGVLADGLERSAMNRENRSHFMSGRLVMISPFDPSAGFNVGHAMQRNKLIYALSNAALVVSSDYDKGGTWTGAVEQLDKLKYVPVYIRTLGPSSKGLDGLRHKGALPWPNPSTTEELANALSVKPKNERTVPIQEELVYSAEEQPSTTYVPQIVIREGQSASEPQVDCAAPDLAKELFLKVTELMHQLQGSHTDSEISSILNVTKSQAKEWIERAIREGWMLKQGKPMRYTIISK